MALSNELKQPVIIDNKTGAGGIVADMREQGDYIDWYCSGIGNSEDGYGLAGNKPEQGAYVPEGVVTEEIELDLNRLGWRPVPWSNDDN